MSYLEFNEISDSGVCQYLTDSQALVLTHIAIRVNEKSGQAWPSTRTLATTTGLAKRTVGAAVQALRKLDILRSHRSWSERTRTLVTYYRVAPREAIDDLITAWDPIVAQARRDGVRGTRQIQRILAAAEPVTADQPRPGEQLSLADQPRPGSRLEKASAPGGAVPTAPRVALGKSKRDPGRAPSATGGATYNEKECKNGEEMISENDLFITPPTEFRIDEKDTTPKPALVPVEILDQPANAVAVYNTLEIDDHEKEDPSMDDLTRARAAELLEIEQEIGNRLRSEIIHDADDLEKVRHQLAETRRRRRHLETLLSDEEWHARARTAGATGSERLVDVIAALVVQRWPDFPYQIEWPQRLAQMVEAYRAAGRRGRDLLDDLLTASAAADRYLALMILMSQSLTEEEENATDDRDEDLHALPAGEADGGVLPQPKWQARAAAQSDGLRG